jgi:hypothetical protein
MHFNVALCHDNKIHFSSKRLQMKISLYFRIKLLLIVRHCTSFLKKTNHQRKGFKDIWGGLLFFTTGNHSHGARRVKNIALSCLYLQNVIYDTSETSGKWWVSKQCWLCSISCTGKSDCKTCWRAFISAYKILKWTWISMIFELVMVWPWRWRHWDSTAACFHIWMRCWILS